MNDHKTILAIGSIAIDTIETPGGNKNNILGGSATYFSLAAGLLAPVKLVGVVGSDYPDAGWDLFKSRGINLENVQVVDGKTFRWGGRYNHDFSTRDTLFTELGVFEFFSPIIAVQDSRSPLVFLGNIHPDLQLDVARSTDMTEYIVSDTMNLWINLYPHKLAEVIAITQIFLLNHEEAFQYTGENSVSSAAAKLRLAGPDVVVIKMGSEGAYLSYNEGSFYVPVFPVEKVVDPTGAGDSFAGGFMGCLARSVAPDFVQAVLTGSAMASFCVEGFGPTPLLSVSMPLLEERISFIKKQMSKMKEV